jgi:hypothetical protein
MKSPLLCKACVPVIYHSLHALASTETKAGSASIAA